MLFDKYHINWIVTRDKVKVLEICPLLLQALSQESDLEKKLVLRLISYAVPYMQRLLNIDHKKHNITERGAD